MMDNSENANDISRLRFLRESGFIAAGLIFLPDFLVAASQPDNSADSKRASNSETFQIVLPNGAGTVEKEAAAQLQHYLSAISGLAIPLIAESNTPAGNGIYIGQTVYAKAQNIDFDRLNDDAYIIRTINNNLIIAGGARNGVLYGVYDLLEGLGCRKYAPDYTYIPERKDITLKGIDRVFDPAVTYRTTSYGQMGGQDYSDWHKLSSRSDWGLFVHTFGTLIPAREYGRSHPEYYSLINGKRQPTTQLCLSNPEVAELLISQLKKRTAANPTATYWSVSQDDNDQYCRCDACTALNEKYGNVPSGSIIYFVNKIAKAFPDKIISTLAYWYSRKAPKNIAIEPNVNIMLCNIESRRQAPVFETDPAFSNDLKDWGALTNDILIWDYNIQFTNFFAPFPNLHTIKPNIRFYTDNHVNALFMQANNEPAAEMALLRSYLISKLMWQPDADENEVINDFLNGYYGAAGSYIRRYIDTMQQSLLKSGMQLNIFGDPIDAKEAFLSAPMMVEYTGLFDAAEKAVSGDAELLRRVQVARLPIMYAAIQIGRTEIDTDRSMYQHSARGTVVAKPLMQALVNQFVDGCQREKVRLVRERSGSPDHFLAAYKRIFTNMEETDKTKSFGKKVIPITSADPQSKSVDHLTDGVFASYESWQSADANWVFYTGEHMDFVLDLGEVMPLNSINMDFLNPQAQPDWHLMALPRYLTYEFSTDGEKYGNPTRIDNPHNPNPVENPGISKISIQPFQANLNAGTKARYIRVHAESLLKTPSWHIRSGQPISIYSDQIVVR